MLTDTMRKEVKQLIERVVAQTQRAVPEYGDFAPILDFFPTPDPRTQEFVGSYGLRVFKMPKDVVPDPRKRYVEAAAYVPSGRYKSDCVVASGSKDEILAIMQTEAFAEKLQKELIELAELFEHYD